MAQRAPNHVHWMAPTFMLLSFISGTLLALGHHVFYKQLDGTPASANDYHVGSLSYSKQQANLQVGTLFAFLVKVLLALSASIAYTQVFWRAFSGSNEKAIPTLSRIDVAFSALGNIFSLFHIAVWWRYPMLLPLAVLVWLVPIASIITPATLSIEVSMRNQSSMLPVPYLNFTSLSFSDMSGDIGFDQSGRHYPWAGPSQAVKRIATAVSMQGNIIPLIAPSPNSSWHLEFLAPSLKCDPMDSARRKQVVQNIADFYIYLNAYDFATNGEFSNLCEGGSNYVYLGWYQDLPFLNQSSNYTFSDASLSSTAGSNATISIAILPEMTFVNNACVDFPSSQIGNNSHTSFVDPNIPLADQPLGTVGESATMIQCQFFNSTYSVGFAFVNGEQSTIVDAPVRSSDEAFTTFNAVTQSTISHDIDPNDPGTLCFALNDDLSAGNETPADATQCRFDSSILRHLAYQGIIEGFTDLLNGTVITPANDGISQNTRILDTILVQTQELGFLDDESSSYLSGSINSLGWADGVAGALASVGIVLSDVNRDINVTALNVSLSTMLEEMFRNYTISLMSSDLLQPNISQPEKPVVNLMTYGPQNIYIYSASKLWLAYGIAILLTALAVIQGLVVMYLNNASYTNNFSTVMRSAWNAELSVNFWDTGEDCRDPLPKFLAKATVWLPVTGRDSSPQETLRDESLCKENGPLDQHVKAAGDPGNDINLRLA